MFCFFTLTISCFLFGAVAKPLVVDGTAKSHELSLAYDSFSLSKLDPPIVLQEFVNHGMCYYGYFIYCFLSHGCCVILFLVLS